MTHSFRLSIYLDFINNISEDTPVQTVNLLTMELQLRVEGSKNLLSLFK